MNQVSAEMPTSETRGINRRSTGDSEHAEFHMAKISSVPIALLVPGESPRTTGPDQAHVFRLAQIDEALPPILVLRSDMRVIDGMHRLLAALIRGQETIEVEFFEGSSEEAFLRAVQANVAHGLPLSQADRRAAAVRIIASHPQMSDRAIARASGLGAKAVASLRSRSADATSQSNARIGRDGRVRPLNNAEGRWRAAEVMAENPQASLREVARIARISPATASDVRKRIQSGELPAGTRPSAAKTSAALAPPTLKAEENLPLPSQVGHRPEAKGRLRQQDPARALQKLLRDPSLRLKEEGRNLLRLLQYNAAAEWSDLIAAVPPHCVALVGTLALQYADAWQELAQHLAERDHLATG